jgi:hypothetical protein
VTTVVLGVARLAQPCRTGALTTAKNFLEKHPHCTLEEAAVRESMRPKVV